MNARAISTVFLAASLAACGGGGGPAAPEPPPTGGIDARGAPRVAVTSRGKISGFGSVIVNGVRYDTSNATFDIDNQAGSESDLAVGQVITIQGSTDDTGGDPQADAIFYDDLVEGPVDAVDAAQGTLSVLGQTITVDNDTIFDDDFTPRDISGVSVGQVVEVSGFRGSANTIRATYIDLDDDGDDFELFGTVSNVDTAVFTFEIGSLLIDYSTATLDDFPNGQPENGQTVEVEGAFNAGGDFVATEVDFEDEDLSDLDGEDVEIEGLITRFVSATDFDVDGVPVTTNDDTDFSNGTVNDLALDVAVDVDGEVNAEGVIVADDIEFELESDLELRGIVEATTDSSITLLGVTAAVNAETDFVDNSSSALSVFSLADVNVGDYVEVRGFDTGSGLTLTGVEREDDDGESGVVGIVTSVSDPDFVAVGVSISTNADTEFVDEDDEEIAPATFFATAEGNEVDVVGTFANGVLTAEEVELDDE